MTDEIILPQMTGLPFSEPKTDNRFIGLLWGDIGSGKTPLAITAPSPILFLLWDQDGDKSVRHVSHRYKLIDLTNQPIAIVDQFVSTKSIFYADLCKMLETGYFKTILFDSITAFLDRALIRGVDIAASSVKMGIKPTYILPQLTGYGARASLMRMCAATLHEAASKYNVSLIFTAHKNEVYTKNERGESELESYTYLIPGEAGKQIPRNISEVWFMRDYEGQRRIYLRNWNKFQPMRTRMFTVDQVPYFAWKFDADKWEGEGIEDWVKQSNAALGRKIPMPK